MALQFTDAALFIEWVENQKRFSPKVDMEKMRYWCRLLENPHLGLKVIHVTGTNGKGSTVSFISSMLLAGGFHVATYTSPYVTRFHERIRYDGIEINDQELLIHANKILSLYDLEHSQPLPTFFEFITLLAFSFFASLENLDYCVIEVGMGGRLDATNVLTPLVSVITNVSYDHMAILGNSLEEILIEKLGIVKPQIPLVTGVKDETLLDIIKERRPDSPVYLPLRDDYKIIEMTLDRTVFIKDKVEYTIHLCGYHQVENALVALEVMKILSLDFPVFRKSKISNPNVIYQRGLEETRWPGRFEVICRDPLIVIDGGHNQDGIKRGIELIDALPYNTKRCVFACSDDKEKAVMIHQLEPHYREMIFTAFSYKRHSNSEELFQESTHKNKHHMTDLLEIIEYTFNNPYEITVYIGSLYFVSEIRPLILNYKK